MISEATPLVSTTPISAANDDTATALRRARRLLYTSHFAAQFSEQAWQFGLILFLAAFTNYTSLILVSSYGLISGLVVCIAGPSAGRYFVDSLSWNRLSSARFLIWAENGSVLIGTAFCYALLVSQQQQHGSQASQKSTGEDDLTLNWFQRELRGVPLDLYSVMLLLGIHIFGPLAQILDKAFLVAIERDWVVVMGKVAADMNHHDPKGSSLLSSNLQPSKMWLSETNVFMKQIDLTCKIVAPTVAGFIIGAATSADASNRNMKNSSTNHASNNLAFAALLVGMVNVASLVVEYLCTARIYKLVPALAFKYAALPSLLLNSNNKSCDEETEDHVNDTPSSSREKVATCCAIAKLPPGLKIYLEQPISWGGLGLAMLYLNVLSFGGLMTAFLVWRGMNFQTVGWWRGVSSALGLVGTFVYHLSTKRFTLVTTGMWSVLYQLACISLSFGSLFVGSYDASMFMLIAGVCASRIGLWVFDITVTQLMQEFIPEGIRGVVGGTQQSLNAFFQLSSFALGLIFPDPRDFPIYVSTGYAAVFVAAMSYAFGVFFRKDKFLTESERTKRQQIMELE